MIRWLRGISPVLLAAGLIVGQLFFAGAQPALAMPMYAVTSLGVLCATAIPLRQNATSHWLCLAAALVFAIYLLIRTALSPTYHLARENFFNILCALSVYLSTTLALWTPKSRRPIIWAIIGLIVPNVFFGAIQFFKDPTFTVFQLPRPKYEGRASGLFVCPNHFAGFLEMALPFCLSLLFLSRSPVWQRVLSGYLALVAIFGVFISGSRGGYLSTAISLGCWSLFALWIRGRVNPASLVKSAFALLAVSLIIAAGVRYAMDRSPLLRERFEKIVNFQDFRFLIWPAALQEFNENRVFGAGAQQFIYYGRKNRDPRIQNDPVHAHNDYLQVLADYGAVGGILALIFLTTHIGFGIVRLRQNVASRSLEDPRFQSDSVAWSSAALAAVSGLAAHSAVDFNMHIPANAWLAAFLFGILANQGLPVRFADQNRINSESSGTSFLPFGLFSFSRVILFVVGLGLFSVPISSAHAEYHREKARLNRRLGKHGDAIKHGTIATSLDPKNGHSWMILGDSKRRLSIRVEDPATRRVIRRSAEKDLRRAAELLPKDAETWRYWGRTLDTLERFEEAAGVLNHAKSLDPNLYLTHEFLGWHFELQGLFEEAEAAYKQALKLYPSTVAAEQLAGLTSKRSISH